MKLNKTQKNILIGLGLAVLSYILFFRRKKETESSFLDIKELKKLDKVRISQILGIACNEFIDIGDGFNITSPKCKTKGMYKKYIDGTLQKGLHINDKNEYRGGEEVTETITEEGKEYTFKRKQYIPVPADKGFTKGDGRGNYFYFEALPEWKMLEIKKLEQLKADAEEKERKRLEAEAKAKEELDARMRLEAQKRAEEAKIKAEEAKRKYELEKKAAEEKAAAEKLNNEQIAKQKQEAALQRKKKNNTIILIISLVVISVVSYFAWKKYKK